MDRFISYFAMPIGVMICFGPAILVWLKEEFLSPGERSQDDRK